MLRLHSLHISGPVIEVLVQDIPDTPFEGRCCESRTPRIRYFCTLCTGCSWRDKNTPYQPLVPRIERTAANWTTAIKCVALSCSHYGNPDSCSGCQLIFFHWQVRRKISRRKTPLATSNHGCRNSFEAPNR